MMVEVLRGAATATLPNTFEALLGLFNSLLSPLLALHHAFRQTASVVALLLKLADDIVEAMTAYIESPQQKEQLLNWVLQLLAQYRDSNLWQVSGRPQWLQSWMPLLFVCVLGPGCQAPCQRQPPIAQTLCHPALHSWGECFQAHRA